MNWVHTKLVVLVSICVWGFSLENSLAQTAGRAPIGIDFFAKIKSISQIRTIGDDIFFVLRQADTKEDNYTSDLYQLVDGQAVRLTSSGQVKALTDTLASVGSLAISENQQSLVYTITDKRNVRAFGNRLYLRDATSGEVRDIGLSEQIYDGEQYDLGVSILVDVKAANRPEPMVEKQGIVYNTTAVDYAPLVRLDLKTKQTEALTPHGFDIGEYIPYQKGYLLIATEGQGGQELYTFDGKTAPKRISDINTEVFASVDVVHPKEILYTNGAGQQMRGYVLPPADYEPGKRYPTNPRGSSGNGSEYAKLKGDFGGRDYDDLMAFVDAALAQVDFIDKDRLGVTGGSYGGVMTNSSVLQRLPVGLTII